MKPTPGRRSANKPQEPTPVAKVPEQDNTVLLTKVIREDKTSSIIAFGQNPLLAEANVILSLIGQIRATSQYGDIQQLRDAFIQKIRDYETRLRLQDITNKEVDTARFCLCCLVDESILNTVWGGQSIWGDNSLLSTFYTNTQGGEQFYQHLDEALLVPAESANLLELQYICMSLGFVGRYRLEKNGLDTHRSVRKRVFDTLNSMTSNPSRYLVNDWQSKVLVAENAAKESAPIWVVLSITGAMLAAMFMSFSYQLNTASNQTFSRLLNLVPTVEHTPSQAVAIVPAIANRISESLLTETERGVVQVQSLPDRVRISFLANQLFQSGSAELMVHTHPILSKVARALEGTTGKILVIGHTDDQPIFTSKFPSNWHLSLARATSVTDQLARSGDLRGRLLPEGMGDARPIVENDSEENRAKNRRVEIDLIVTQRTEQGDEQ